MPRATSPYHHGNLRAELLSRAAKELETNGVAGLSLRELARQARVSHAAPRQHFPDKQALLNALAVTGLERLGHELDAALDRAAGSFKNRLTAFAQAYVGFATQHPALLTLMFAQKDDTDSAALCEAHERAFAAPSTLVDDALTAGDITSDDPDRVVMALMATLQGLAMLSTNDMIGDRPLEQVVDGTIQTLVDGLSGHRA